MTPSEKCVFDIEVAPNVVVLGIKAEGKEPEHLTITEPLGADALAEIDHRFRGREVAGYNCGGYDRYILAAIMDKAGPETCYEISKAIIEGGRKGWEVAQDRGIPSLDYPLLDLMNFCPRGRLKQYESRLGLAVEDLPFDPNSPITDADLPAVVSYLEHDLLATEVLRGALDGDIQTRKALGEMFGLSGLEFGTAAQASANVIVAEYLRMNPGLEAGDIKAAARLKLNSDHVFRVLPWVRAGIAGTIAESVADQIDGTEIRIRDGRRLALARPWPDEIVIDDETLLEASFGLGGIHSIDDGNQYGVASYDVASLYPHLLLKPGCAPSHLNEEQFHEIYQSMVSRRLEAKRAKDKTTADALKLCLNSTFGAMNFMYSSLYSPLQFIHITVSGQLSLISLADRQKRRTS